MYATLLSFVQISFDLRTDENDEMVPFFVASSAFTVRPLTLAPVINVVFPAFVSLSAGVQPMPITGFQLFSSKAELDCSRVVFDFSASLVCNFSNGTSRAGVAFFSMGNVPDDPAQSEFRGRIRASCFFNVGGWIFITAGSCRIRVSIPVLDIFELTPLFLVDAGPALTGKLIGFLPSQISGASTIWSSNSSGIPCVSVQLSDAFGNLVKVSQEMFLLTAFLQGTVIPYALHGETSVRTDGNGVAHWCNVRVSVVLSQPVCFRVSGPSMNWTLPTCVNISQPGLVSAISLGNASAVLNSMTPILSGAGLPTIRFVASDSAGNIASGNGQSIVIRLRVRRTVLNSSSPMYV
jgi:hypothetical protein